MLRSILCVFLVFLSQFTYAAQSFDEIISFGDSLTDVGNVAGLTEAGVSPRINGYYQETHFSDNILWIETLANYLGLPPRNPGRGDSTSLPPATTGNVWAWGGSEAASGSVQPPGVTEPIPNLLTEVEEYLDSNNPNPRTLYAIWSGADNLLIGGKFGPRAARQAVRAVENALWELRRAGARQFLVFNMPKLGDTPSAQSGGRIDEIAANIYANSYNRALNRMLKRLERTSIFRGKITFVDIYSELVLVVNTVNGGGIYTPSFFVPGPPVAIGNVTSEGLSFFNQTGTFPTNYLF